MILLVACSLALDAFAVALSCGVSVPHFRLRDCLGLGLYFGLFQFLMPMMGYGLGAGLSARILPFDHWVAFGLLTAIGGKMLVESLFSACIPNQSREISLSPLNCITLAIATSIDALAVGVSLALVPSGPIFPHCVLIGLVAFGFTLAGGLLGRRLGGLFQQRATLLGGLVLISMGVRILLNHLG